MGHKITPNLFRLGNIKTWSSRWFADKNSYKNLIKEDVAIRELLSKKLNKHFVDRIEIDRDSKKFTITIVTAKPGVVIGKNGLGVEDIKTSVSKIINTDSKVKMDIDIVIKEFKNPDLSAAVIAEQARLDVERRIPFKKVMKKLIDKAKQAGAKGIKISMAGRLNGVEIARRETLSWGSIPLHTIRADISYFNDKASTIYGSIGIKVWVYKGLVFGDKIEGTEEEKPKTEEKKQFKPFNKQRTFNRPAAGTTGVKREFTPKKPVVKSEKSN